MGIIRHRSKAGDRLTVSHLVRRACILFAAVFFVLGCTERYFTDAGEPLAHVYAWDAARPPALDYWTGIVFNGRKIGFSHVRVNPSPDGSGRLEIHSEAALHFRLLMFDKKVVLKSYDLVADDLSLIRFAYEYNLDGNTMRIDGTVEPGLLRVDIGSKGRTDHQAISLSGPIYPTSAITLYPAVHGLAVGGRYGYPVYDGETQSVGTVTQEVLAYEKSELFSGEAFRVRTDLQNQEVTTWLDRQGRPVFEMSMGGVIIAAMENEREAKEYLAQASLNKAETMLEFSLIPASLPGETDGGVMCMKVALGGLDPAFELPSDETQSCRRSGQEMICRIFRADDREGAPPSGSVAAPGAYLTPSRTVPCLDPAIVRKAKEIAGGAGDAAAQIPLLIEWMQENIEKLPVDVFSAVDVLSGKKAECQGHAYLYTAFARSLGIPSRVVNGIVYAASYGGFLYHTWAESLVDGRWLPVDPALNQLPADATHVKFVEGELPSDLLPLVGVIGRISVHVISVDGG